MFFIKNNTPLYYSRTLLGHRREYLEFAIGLFGGERGGLIAMLFSRRPAFFLMIEDGFLLYVLVAVWRSVFRRVTVGLLFRPKPAVDAKTLRLKIKRAILIGLKRLSSVRTFSIIPCYLDHDIENIVDDWIYDFQLWDINSEKKELYDQICSGGAGEGRQSVFFEVTQLSKGRAVIGAIGRQDKDKGFDLYCSMVSKKGMSQSYYPVVAGKIDCSCKESLELLKTKDSFILDRYVSDLEMIEVYAASKLIWCAYAENYDQASGVLGRAIQFGVPVIVRDGSISHKFCVSENLPHIVSSCFDKDTVISAVLKDERAAEKIQVYRNLSVRKLCDAMRLSWKVY